MKKATVKNTIFVSNARMILTTLCLVVLIKLVMVKVYTESVETEITQSLEQIQGMDKQELEQLVKQWSVYQTDFFLILAADGVLCIAALILVSRFFTKRLTDHVMEPLQALQEGAERVKEV